MRYVQYLIQWSLIEFCLWFSTMKNYTEIIQQAFSDTILKHPPATALNSQLNAEYVLIIMNALESKYSGNNIWTQISNSGGCCAVGK